MNKDPDADWNTLKPQIYTDLTDFFASGQPVLLSEEEAKGPADTQPSAEDDECGPFLSDKTCDSLLCVVLLVCTALGRSSLCLFPIGWLQ